MVSLEWCRVMAAYNSEMNRRLYAAADGLTEEERRAERGAFWGSLQGTLSHLLWGDRMWMSRFAGWPAPDLGIRQSGRLIEGWAALKAARAEADAGIEAWAAGLREEWLAAPLTWHSAAVNRTITMPAWIPVAHFFNHQTHHRGQVHCLLTQAGQETGDTDLPWVVDPEALGLGLP